MAVTTDRATRRIQWLSLEESREAFDALARELMNMSGSEFIRRWDAGDFRAISDDPDHPEIMRLASLIPFGR